MEGDNADIKYTDLSEVFDTVSQYHLQVKMKMWRIPKEKRIF